MKKGSTTQEFETTVLNIDPEKIRLKLRKLGAKEKPEVLMRRRVYDLHPNKPEFVRIRDNGHKITLTYKNKKGSTIGSAEEVEIEVDDFDKTVAILSRLKFYNNRYQENKRQSFFFEGIEFSIDSWPKIPPYLEIEANSGGNVRKGLKLLGLTSQDSGDIDTQEIFLGYGIDLNSFAEFKFE